MQSPQGPACAHFPRTAQCMGRRTRHVLLVLAFAPGWTAGLAADSQAPLRQRPQSALPAARAGDNSTPEVRYLLTERKRQCEVWHDSAQTRLSCITERILALLRRQHALLCIDKRCLLGALGDKRIVVASTLAFCAGTSGIGPVIGPVTCIDALRSFLHLTFHIP
jgi:hypothetical protein